MVKPYWRKAAVVGRAVGIRVGRTADEVMQYLEQAIIMICFFSVGHVQVQRHNVPQKRDP